jgi:CRISPR/Cas system-associated exonuclease Cas4 (RecB family)
VSYKKYTREKVEKALEEQRNSTEKKVVKVKIPETETNCKHCGAALREGLRYCPYCGEKCTDDL